MPVRARRVAALAALPTVIITGVGVGVAVAAGPSATAAAPGATAPAYVGSAYALKAELALAGGTVLDQLLPEIVKFPSGGDKSVLELPAELSETATLKVLNANAAVKNNVLRSNARTAGLSVLTELVSAAVLNADCTAEGEKVTGDGQVTDLRIAGIKVPVDPGPNFKVEIPKELEPFLSGGIWVDRQDTLKDGTLRVRALQVRLVIDPLRLQGALESLVAEVRAAAAKVVTVVEDLTGDTLEQIVAKERAARGLVAPAAPATDGTGTSRNGTASARDDLRAEYAARQAAAQADREAAVREQQARAAEAGAAEARQRALEARAAAEAGTTEGSAARAAAAPEAGPPRTAKADRADVARAAEGQAAARDEAAQADVPVETKRDRAQPQAGEPTAGQAAAEDPAAQEASADEPAAETAAARAVAAEREAERAEARAQAARAAADDARSRAERDAQSPAAPAARAGAAPARQGAAPVAPAAEDPADEEVGGTLGVNVIVSQVTCKGAKVVKPAAVPETPADEPEDEREALPRTGGNGNALGLGVAGLGLLLAGSAAVFVARRRGRHAR